MICGQIPDTVDSRGWSLTPFERSEGFHRDYNIKLRGDRKVSQYTLPISLKVGFAAASALLSMWEPLFIPITGIFAYFSIKTARERSRIKQANYQIFQLKKKVFDLYEVMRIIRSQNSSLAFISGYSEVKKEAKHLIKTWDEFPLADRDIDTVKEEILIKLKELSNCSKKQINSIKVSVQASLKKMTEIGHTQGPIAKLIEQTEKQIGGMLAVIQ